VSDGTSELRYDGLVCVCVCLWGAVLWVGHIHHHTSRCQVVSYSDALVIVTYILVPTSCGRCASIVAYRKYTVSPRLLILMHLCTGT
jgi:hypothetical protein